MIQAISERLAGWANKCLRIVLVLLLASIESLSAEETSMPVLSPSPKFTALDSTGAPLAGGQLYTYAAGTTTPLTTYTDSTGTVANTNPVVLNSRGEADIWLSSLAYKYVLKDSIGNLIWTVDNVTPTLVPQILSQSAQQVAVPNTTNETTVATITIPANTMGANGFIRIGPIVWTENSAGASNKTVRVKLGGTTVATFTHATNTAGVNTVYISPEFNIANTGLVNAQSTALPFSLTTGIYLASSATIATAVDTSIAASLTITMQKGTAADTLRLESYQALIYPKL